MSRNQPPKATYPKKDTHTASSKRNGSNFSDRYGAGRVRAAGATKTLGSLSAAALPPAPQPKIPSN
jgi:hypothetical protein